ncbi:GNAT family N-acetyltransferase [Flavivirga abyssicola]|uniref:GNAT family N-acetyltransferase n=1 Tax=Flavivirga abyssicola TaxID=3063533 RepID=UPI0026E09032|nr:GNAT family N-acetyltransferase [Flavivirga sp. MEBiC07777]WVK12577.1 GNAT family N-acetyltransferase [Flavivirga sp. MEBiC07777]
MEFDNYSIRKLNSNDVHNYFQLLENNRDRLREVFTDTVLETTTIEDTKVFLSKMKERMEGDNYLPHVVIEEKTTKFIGFIDVKHIDWNIPKGELGLYIDKDYSGKGIMTKALKLFCEYAFNKYHFAKLFLRTHTKNISMQKVAEKCGFQKEGVIRKDYKTTSGEIIDLVYYGKLNSNQD